MTTIEKECAKRDIDCLLHFTPVDHLPSILKYGLFVPSRCSAVGVGMKPNDEFRFDGQDAICLSIEWPNWSLFWRFQQQAAQRPWAVIAVKHHVLWTKRVCFNTTNAADAAMSRQTFEARQGFDSFVALFDDWGVKKRVDLKIGENFPTNHQAEVLSLDTIEPTDFHAVHINKQDAAYDFRGARVPTSFDTHFFKPRHDWEHWK